MKRIGIFAVLINLLLAGCTPQNVQPSPTPTAPQTTAATGSNLADAASKVKDACTLVPKDLAAKLVPNASAPQSSQYPPSCNVTNGTAVINIELDNGPTDPVPGAEFIPGLAQGAYLEHLNPHSSGDVYITIDLSKNPDWLMHVEMDGYDGKDHKQDGIDVAKAALAILGGQ